MATPWSHVTAIIIFSSVIDVQLYNAEDLWTHLRPCWDFRICLMPNNVAHTCFITFFCYNGLGSRVKFIAVFYHHRNIWIAQLTNRKYFNRCDNNRWYAHFDACIIHSDYFTIIEDNGLTEVNWMHQNRYRTTLRPSPFHDWLRLPKIKIFKLKTTCAIHLKIRIQVFKLENSLLRGDRRESLRVFTDSRKSSRTHVGQQAERNHFICPLKVKTSKFAWSCFKLKF